MYMYIYRLCVRSLDPIGLTVLHHTATHCNSLQHTALHCSTGVPSDHILLTAHCNTLQHRSTIRSYRAHGAACCSQDDKGINSQKSSHHRIYSKK